MVFFCFVNNLDVPVIFIKQLILFLYYQTNILLVFCIELLVVFELNLPIFVINFSNRHSFQFRFLKKLRGEYN